MRRLISFILAVVFIFQTAFPALAMIASLEDLEKRNELFKTVGVLQTSRHFASDPDKTGGGILPVAIHEGRKMVLVALRNDGLGWCNFGGGSDAKDETVGESCSREAKEESLNAYALHPYILKNCFSHDLYNPAAALEARSTPTFLAQKKIPQILLYRMYITPVEYVSASVFKEKLALATEAHHKEYTDFVWVPLEDLMNVVQGNTTFSTVLSKIRNEIPSVLPPKTAPEGADVTSPQDVLFEPFFEMLRASPVQSHLKNLLKEEDPNNRSSFARESHTISLAGNTAHLPQSTSVKWDPVSLKENPAAQNFLAQQISRTRTVFLGKPPSAQNLFATSTEEDLERDFVLGTKTFDSPQQKYFYSEKRTSPETVLYQEEVSFDPNQERKYFNEALAYKIRMNLQFKEEMKKRAKEKYEATHMERSAPSIPSPQDTATEAHLRLWLGETYLPKDHKANINALIEKFGMKKELGRDVDLTIEALTRLSTVLEIEKKITSDPRLQKMPFGYETYYHGCREEMILLNQVTSALENLFSMRDDGEFSTLRGTFSYMDKYKEMTKALETYHQDHRAFYISLYNQYKSENRDPALIESSVEYRTWAEHQKDKIHKIWKETLPIEGSKKDNNQLMLWLNAALTAGHMSTSVSSSTLEYFLNAHSAKEPCDALIFRKSMALRGIEASYEWFQSLGEQYVKPLAPTGESNGGLLQVFVTTALTDIYMNTVEPGGGRLYGHPVHIPEADRKPYVSRMLEKLREEANKGTLSPEEQAAREVMETLIRKLENAPPLDEKNLMKSLISEVCLMLHPLLTQAAFVKQAPEAAGPDTVDAMRSYDAHYQNSYFPPLYTKGYFRYPLSDEKKKAFDFKLSQVASALMADWLNQGTKPLEGSFYKSPALFDFYKQIYKDFTGETPPQETYKNSLPYLINMGDLETVKSFLSLHPDALTTLKIDFKKCFMQLLCDEHWDMFLYLFESLKEHQDFTDFFTPFNQKLIAGIIADSKSFSEEAEAFFKSHLDVTTFDEAFKESLLSNALNPDELTFLGHEPLPTSRTLKFFIDMGLRISSSSAQKDIPVQKRIEKFRSLYNPYVPVEEKDERGFTLLEQLLDFTDPFQEGQTSIDLSGFLISLLQRGANWKSETRTPGIPILFELLKYIYPSKIQTVIESIGNALISSTTLETEDFPEESLQLLFSETLESEDPKEISPPSLQDILSALETYKTSEGLTCFQYLQRAYLEGSSVLGLSGLKTLLLSQKDVYKHLSYPPFLRFFPENEYLSDTNPWASKEARHWQREIDEALATQNEGKISELIERCMDTDLLRINSKFFSSLSNTYDALREAYSSKMFEADKRWSQEKEPYKRQWRSDFKTALENPAESAEEELKHLINTLATRNDYYPDMFEELSTLKTRFPDLHTLYEEKDQLFVDFIFEKKKETHLLATEHEALACALQTQKKEDIKTTFQAFKEKVEEILSTPDATVRTPGFYYKSLWFIELEPHHRTTLREREIDQRRDVLIKNKVDLDEQKKEWRDTVQKAVDGEDMESLTSLISADPHGIFSAPDTSSHQYISYPLLSQLSTNKFKSLLPLLVKKVKNWKRFLETADRNNQHEFLMSFCENYPDLLSFLKKEGNLSCFHGIHENLPTLLLKHFPQFLKDPIETIGDNNFCILFYTSLENKEMSFLTSLPPSVFKQAPINSAGSYFWSFAFYPHTHQFAQNLVKEDPSFLTLRGYLEMSLQEYVDLSKSVEDENSQTKPLEIFLKKITP